LTSSTTSTYSWIATSNANVTGESTSSQSSTTLSNTLTLSTGTAQVVSYTVTPFSNPAGCAGNAQTVLVTVNPLPTITTSSSASASARCLNTSAQTSALSYSATTNSPTSYTITWDASALAAGLISVGSTALPVSPVTLAIAANVPASTYTGSLVVTNGNGCAS